MSKKKRKGKRSAPNISASALLRPRLDRFLQDDELGQTDDAKIRHQLDSFAAGVDLSEFLATLLRAASEAPSESRQRVGEAAAQWLSHGDRLDTLTKLLNNKSLSPESAELSRLWLKEADIVDEDVFQALDRFEEAKETSFHSAAIYEGDFQGIISLCVYTDTSHRRTRCFVFLIDFCEPWLGAVKDVTFTPSENASRASATKYMSADTDKKITELSPAEAKFEILGCLNANRRQGIRLPVDLIRRRKEFERYLLPLPDGPDTIPFSMEDFDAMSSGGKSPEKLSIIEKELPVFLATDPNSGKRTAVAPPVEDETWDAAESD